jgi:hypothetical protein
VCSDTCSPGPPALARQERAKFVTEFAPFGIDDIPSDHRYHIEPRRQIARSEYFANPPLRFVPSHGPADLSRSGHPEPAVCQGIGKHEQGHQTAMGFCAVGVDLLEIRPSREMVRFRECGTRLHRAPFGRWVMRINRFRRTQLRNCKTFASLGAPALQHESAILGAHAHEKAMRASPAPLIGLECPLHPGTPHIGR